MLLDSHLHRPTLALLGGLALLYLAQVARRLLEHGRFVRLLRRFASEGQLGGAPARYVNGVAPFVAGIVRLPARVLRSRSARMLTDRQQRAVAMHERHHIQRRDPLRLQLSGALQPLTRLVAGLGPLLDAHNVRREIAADRYAIQHGATRADVASALLAMLEDDQLHLAPGFISMAEIRLRALSDDAVAPPVRSRHLPLTLGLAARVVISCIAFL